MKQERTNFALFRYTSGKLNQFLTFIKIGLVELYNHQYRLTTNAYIRPSCAGQQ